LGYDIYVVVGSLVVGGVGGGWGGVVGVWTIFFDRVVKCTFVMRMIQSSVVITEEKVRSKRRYPFEYR